MALNVEAKIDLKKASQDEKANAKLTLQKNPLLVSILDAVQTLRTLDKNAKLPPGTVSASKGLLTLRTDKVGLGISVTQGYGLIMQRLPGTEKGWSAPVPVKVDGVSLGAVMGYSEQHSVICLANDEDIQSFMKNKRAMKIGLDFGLNVGKKMNKNSSVSSNQSQKNDVSGHATQAFTLSKGYIVDVSLHGTSVEPDTDDICTSYGAGVTPLDILSGKAHPPKEAALLYKTIRDIEDKFSAPAI